MSATAILSSDFQLTLPEAVCEKLNWKAGQELMLLTKGKGVLVMPAPELEQLAGIAQNGRGDGYRDRNDRF